MALPLIIYPLGMTNIGKSMGYSLLGRRLKTAEGCLLSELNENVFYFVTVNLGSLEQSI